jgi:hypothetical protein
MGKSEIVYFLRQDSEGYPLLKKVVQTSPSITFYTRVVEPHCFFIIIIILFVAHVQFETGGQEYKRGQ